MILKNARKDEKGTVAILTAVCIPVLIGFIGLAVDMGYIYYTKSRLQGATDSAALHFAGKNTATHHLMSIGIKDHDAEAMVAEAIQFALPNLPAGHNNNAIVQSDFEYGEWDVANEVFMPESARTITRNAVRVVGKMAREEGRNNPIDTFFTKLFHFTPDISVESFAVAPIVPAIHVLHPTARGALRTATRTDIDSGDVWINSNARHAILAGPNTSFGSPTITAGDANISARNLFPNRYPIDDLLAAEKNPTHSGCDYINEEIDTTVPATISPGVYCGGLRVKNVDVLTLLPGEYHFVDGPFRVETANNVVGTDVLLHFDGVGAHLQLFASTYRISGRQSGDHAGYVIFSNRDTTENSVHQTSHRGQLSGVFYAPVSHVALGGPVDGVCHSMCLVAETLYMKGFTNWYSGGTTFTSFTGAAMYLPPPNALLPSLRPNLIASAPGQTSTP